MLIILDIIYMESFNKIKDLYYEIQKQPKLDSTYAMIFVYNSEETIRDKEHFSECIPKTEKNMIVSSFRKVFDYVYPIDGEDKFMKKIIEIKQKHKYIFVYSMAQNIDGIGRRCLIPLLCDYYNLMNISASFMASTYSDNKYLMYEFLLHQNINCFPKTKYFIEEKDFDYMTKLLSKGKWMIKPNDESASIGVYCIDFTHKSYDEIKSYLQSYQKKYPIFCIQEFIDGQEVAVPLFWMNNNYYCPGISEVVFESEQNYLDYDTVMLENYHFQEYIGDLQHQLIDVSIKVANAFNFKGISRIDFRIANKKIYIEDIGANPTISETNGVNILFREKLLAESSCVYELLVYSKLIELGLFIPSLY